MVSSRTQIVLDIVVELSELFRVPLSEARLNLESCGRVKRWDVSVFQIVNKVHAIDRKVGGGHGCLKMKLLVSVKIV